MAVQVARQLASRRYETAFPPRVYQRCHRSGEWVVLLVCDGINVATRSMTVEEARQLRQQLDMAIDPPEAA